VKTKYTGRDFAIHLGVDDKLAAAFRAEALGRGIRVIELDLTNVPDRPTLGAYLARAFEFPHATEGLDAAVDLISDLESFGDVPGHLVITRGLVEPSEVGDAFASMLPNIVDRWRSQNVPFEATLDGSDDHVQSMLLSANQEMDRAGRLPWAQPGTGAVDVIIHRRDETGTSALGQLSACA